MKIPAINNNLFVQNNSTKQYNPSFQRIRKDVALSEKISHIIPLSDTGDIILIGKNFESAIEGVKNSLGEFSEVIKRILHIKASVAVPMAISLDKDGDFQCVNLGEKTFALVKDLKNPVFPCKHFAVDPLNSINIEQGDVIVNGKKEIELKDWLSEYANTFDFDFDKLETTKDLCDIYDYSGIQQDKTEEINQALVEKITQIKTTQKDATKSKKGLNFDSIGGLHNVKEELYREVIYPIKFPFAYENIALNKGILLYGKPGTGKTLIAESLAGECDAKFIKICGSELESKWVGESEAKWRELFAEAKKNQPAIIFIDEFDSVAKSRENENSTEHGSKVVNQILSLMSDLEKGDDQVFVIAATNFPLLDKALMRAGRFSKQIEITPPDREALSEIFDIHTKNKQLDFNLNKQDIIEKFSQKEMTGADVKYIVNQAHINSWLRCGVFDKMKSGILTKDDMKNVSINFEDFEKAFLNAENKIQKNTRRQIGFDRKRD